MAVGEGFLTKEAFGIFSRNLGRRIGSLEARLGTGGYGGGGGGMDTFRSLMDTPGSYSDADLKYVRVNSGESALEFGARMTISASGPLGGDNGDIWLQYGVPAVHALLSDTHSDTLADSVLAGDLIYGNSTPKWARKAKGNDGQFLKMVSGYPDWAAHGLSYSDVGAAASGHNHSGVYEPVIAGGTSAQYWRGDKSFQTLNQAAVDGLTIANGPTFAHLHLSDLAAVVTPAESWVGPSSTTGIYFKGGNVGIGTTTPGAQLSLGTTLANTKLAVFGGAYVAGFGIQADEFRFHVTAASMDFRFFDAPAGNALMTIKGTGSVGIGTVSPGAKLEVCEAAGSVESRLRTNANAQISHVFLRNESGGSYNCAWYMYVPANSKDLRLFETADRVWFQADGKVGIGGTPTSPFQVVGLPTYANNAAAVAGGLTAGAFYRTNADPDPVCVVH